jgi:katanin p60 ATPase-containing subunit A1
MRRVIDDLSDDEIRQLPEEELDVPITAQDFKETLANYTNEASKENLHKYEEWMRVYGSSSCVFLK